jgi:steroid Delta-isomerase
LAGDPKRGASMPTAEQVRAVAEAYVKAINAGDREAWLDNFADNAEQFDPVGAPPNVGRDALGVFWDNFQSLADEIDFDARDTFVAGDEVAVVFTITVTSSGGRMQFDGVDVFVVDDDGRIKTVKAYWEPAKVRAI